MSGKSMQPLLVDRPRDGVVRLRLNRPSRHNAIDDQLLAGLRGALENIAGDPAARAVVLSSATPAMFCAGADLKVADAVRRQVSSDLYRLYQRMLSLPVPILAALTGPAVGGGAQLAIASDLRVAQPGTWLRFVGPGHGLAVGAWGLPSLIGRGRALDLCLSGRRIGAQAAADMGLVDRIAEDAEAHALDLAAEFSALDPGAVARTKALVGAGLPAALESEAEGNRHWSGQASASCATGGTDA
jgi:enoyl-CoA hydratase/carnithine racemase